MKTAKSPLKKLTHSFFVLFHHNGCVFVCASVSIRACLCVWTKELQYQMYTDKTMSYYLKVSRIKWMDWAHFNCVSSFWSILQPKMYEIYWRFNIYISLHKHSITLNLVKRVCHSSLWWVDFWLFIYSSASSSLNRIIFC